MEQECQQCGFCCSHVKFSLKNDDYGKDYAKFAQLHGCRAVEAGDMIRIYVPIACQYLAHDGRTKKWFCAIHEKDRPKICGDYECKKTKP